jgi:Uroporphyrinogen-III decarboxylase
MKTNQELYNERLNRIKAAIAIEKPDRVPVVIANDAFAANHMGVKMSEYIKDPALCNKTMVDSVLALGGVDGVQLVLASPPALSMLWLAKVEVPGVELAEDKLWQVLEQELMKVEDYDTIINNGWNAFVADYYKNRLDNLMDRVKPTLEYTPQANRNFIEAGIPNINNGKMPATPYELFCGGRTMVKFMRDMYKIPDKVQAAMDTIISENFENTRQMLRDKKPFGCWVGGWRGASEFLRPKLWERFVWPYFKKYADLAIEEGVVPIFHLDGNWERDLEYFKDFPKGKCIISPDSATDIYKIKEVLGDSMCIMGDVPPSMLTLGTPDEVYNYSTKLIKELGPTGYILGQGCDIPPNAKVENVKAMVAAATGK